MFINVLIVVIVVITNISVLLKLLLDCN